MRVVILSALLLLLDLSWVKASEKNETRTANKLPNIIIVMADDMGFDDISIRGAREFLTPNIDALAYHGRLLDRLYAPSMCTPSRGALLSGKYPIHTGTQHYVIGNEEPWGLALNTTLMPEIFREAGYSTNLVGKWHLGFSRPEYTPTHRGFDNHYGYWGAYIDYYQRRSQMPLGNYSVGYDFRRNMQVECTDRGVYVTDLLTNEAERIIREQPAKEQPLFLILSHLAPHTGNTNKPLQAPEEELRKFTHIKDPNRRLYAAMVSKLDESVGRVITALARTDQLENSIVIFYSDNGAPSVGMFSNTGSNWPLKGQKNSPWEGGLRVAGAIWSPLLKARGNLFTQPIYVGDFLPTLAHAAGIELDSSLHLDGIDLWPQLSGPKDAPHVPREILHQLDDVWRVQSLFQGQYKYVNGTTLAGQFDQVLTYRELDDLDPRASRYVVEVRNSPASRALARYDLQRITQARINTISRSAAVICSDMQRGCNALLEECLYDLSTDPCEQNNLAYSKQHSEILTSMRQRVQQLRAGAMAPNNRPSERDADPSLHECTWDNFGVKARGSVPLECDFHGTPCGADSQMTPPTRNAASCGQSCIYTAAVANKVAKSAVFSFAASTLKRFSFS
ncbi:arylsulfatase B [Drosophila grimshawi]|uniref:GH14468 n=1 Tax=Drosophila grimshawi TaxID=7222 RepID=B4J050_DROGR|nr:arylsulfatase B [Drosophila grimshawi]EDV97843.1 GH14468 [Drosophila grimshawi]